MRTGARHYITGRDYDPIPSDISKARDEATQGSRALLERLLTYGMTHGGCGNITAEECRERLRRLPK